MRCFPFALAHEEVVRARRAPPVDAGLRIVVVEMPKLPKGLARSGAPAPMGAMGHGVGDPLRLDQQRRHARSQTMGLGLLGWKWLERSLLALGHAWLTLTA